MKNNQNLNTSDQKYSVMLPCEPDQFKEFISSLLGKPQTITQQLSGTFTLTKDDLVTLYHLISQRVSQQNKGTLIQFTTRIVFDDGSSVLLNSFEDLQTYHEVRPVVSTQVHLSWTFLLMFENKEVPEKQVIDVSFISAGKWRNIEYDHIAIFHGGDSGIASFSIQHTARTWGADIQGMLNNHLETFVTQEHPLKQLIRFNSGKIGFAMICIVLGTTFFGIYRASSIITETQTTVLESLQGSSVALSYKVDGLITFLHTNPSNNFLLSAMGYIAAAICLSIFSGIWIATTTDSSKPSFILLSPMAEKLRKKSLNSYRNKWISFAGSIVFSIATGVVGNIVYTRYWTN